VTAQVDEADEFRFVPGSRRECTAEQLGLPPDPPGYEPGPPMVVEAVDVERGTITLSSGPDASSTEDDYIIVMGWDLGAGPSYTVVAHVLSNPTRHPVVVVGPPIVEDFSGPWFGPDAGRWIIRGNPFCPRKAARRARMARKRRRGWV
jgi:hypothetical protein